MVSFEFIDFFAFQDPPSLKFHNRIDIRLHVLYIGHPNDCFNNLNISDTDSESDTNDDQDNLDHCENETMAKKQPKSSKGVPHNRLDQPNGIVVFSDEGKQKRHWCVFCEEENTQIWRYVL